MSELNRCQIMAMEAGPQMDLLIHHRVLRRGYTMIDGHNAAEKQERINAPKPYSTDMNAVATMIGELQVELDRLRAEPNPLVACRAALLATL